MSKIKREEMVAAIETVRPGVATRGLVPQSNHLAFTGKEIISFNDSICIIHPFKSDFKDPCSVPAEKLYEVLTKIVADELDFSMKDDEIIIEGGKTKAGLSTESGEILLDKVKELQIEKVKGWKPIPAELIQALTLCMFSASKDATTKALSGVYVDRDAVTSSDTLRISQYILPDDIKASFNIPAAVIEELTKFTFEEYFIRDNSWAFFRTKEGTIFCTRLITGDDFPDYNEYFKFKGKKFTLPDTFKSSVEAASIMATGDTESDRLIEVEISAKGIICKGQDAFGWVENEVDADIKIDGSLTFLINPVFLLKILEQTNKVIYGDNKALFESKNFLHLISTKDGGR